MSYSHKNENVALGTVQLNRLIQSLEVKDNENVIRRGQNLVLHIGDKIMQTKNDYSI